MGSPPAARQDERTAGPGAPRRARPGHTGGSGRERRAPARSQGRASQEPRQAGSPAGTHKHRRGSALPRGRAHLSGASRCCPCPRGAVPKFAKPRPRPSFLPAPRVPGDTRSPDGGGGSLRSAMPLPGNA